MDEVALPIALGTLGLLIVLLLVHRVDSARRQRRHADEITACAQRRERERIGRDFHDTFLQGLHVLTWNLQLLSEQLPAKCPVRRAMTAALDLADTMVADGRDRLQLLSSGHAGRSFMHVLRDRGQVFAAGSEIDFSVSCDGDSFELAPRINAEVIRIAGEALVNAFRHARAMRIELRVRYSPDELHVVICDDGCGMSPCLVEAQFGDHFGVGIMRQRAEEAGFLLCFTSIQDCGTRVDLRVPIAAVHAP